jgi:membrane protein EpsK
VTETTTEFKRQLPRNSFLQVLSFVSTVAIGIWLVPYLVRHLGSAAYGLIPIAGSLTQYVALISHSISSAVARFLTMALQRNDHEDANRIFNTAFFSYLAIGLIQIPIFALLIWNANWLFSIPQGLYRDATILLLCSAGAFLINLLSSVFVVPLYAKNRLDISRGMDIARQVLRLTGIVVTFLCLGPKLRYVGYVYLSLSVFLALVRMFVARWQAPMLRLSLASYDLRKVRQLMTMGGWLLVNRVLSVGL